jgi:hypothetical protein
MMVKILKSTTSSPEESLASNLQCDTVLLSSAIPCSRDTESEDMMPTTKKLCKEDSALEVIGPVDSGDRIMAKNGARSVVNGMVIMSRSNELT